MDYEKDGGKCQEEIEYRNVDLIAGNARGSGKGETIWIYSDTMQGRQPRESNYEEH